MNSQDVKKYNLPDKPGVYFFTRQNFSQKNLGGLKQGKDVLYVGKATSLSDRVRSYFSADLDVARGPSIVQMVELADGLSFIETDSVLEALILEAAQIKKHRPKYNVRDKDDKSFNFVVITKEDFPRVLLVRGKELAEMKETKKELLSRIRVKNSDAIQGASGAPEQAVQSATARERMSETSKKRAELLTPIKYEFGPFPYGGELKEALKIVRWIFPYRDKCTPCSVIANDVLPKPLVERGGKQSELGIASSGTPRNDKCRPCFNAQIGLCPGVCSGAMAKTEYALTIKNLKHLFEGRKKDVIKDLEKQMKEFAAKQEFEKAGGIKRKIFSLNHIQDVALIKHRRTSQDGLFRIEAYDIAHLSGKDTVGVMAVVLDGEIDKASYRKFTIKGKGPSTRLGVNKKVQINDVENLKEILSRRFNHDEWPLPQLVVLDGGKAQLKAAQNIIKILGLDIPAVSVVKDEFHRPREILSNDSRVKRIAGSHEREIILANSEAHRFAIHFHRQTRRKVL